MLVELLFVGPIVAALVNKFGCRIVGISGSIFAAFAFILSTFSPSIVVFQLTYGILGGTSFLSHLCHTCNSIRFMSHWCYWKFCSYARFVLHTWYASCFLLLLCLILSNLGFGLGMMYLPAVVGVGFYFEKKRAVATGIAVCGTGIGVMAMAPFAKFLLDHLDWKNTHYVLGRYQTSIQLVVYSSKIVYDWQNLVQTMVCSERSGNQMIFTNI